MACPGQLAPLPHPCPGRLSRGSRQSWSGGHSPTWRTLRAGIQGGPSQKGLGGREGEGESGLLASWPGHPFLPLCTPLCLCRPDVGATARPGGHTWPCPAVWQDGKRVKSPAVAGIPTAVVPSVIRGTSPSFQLPQPPGAAQPVAGAPRASQTCASQDRSALVTWGFLRLNQLHGNKMKNSVS